MPPEVTKSSPTWIDSVKREGMDLLRGLAGAVLAAIGLGITQWFGAHIPDITHFIGLLGGAYIGVKTNVGASTTNY